MRIARDFEVPAARVRVLGERIKQAFRPRGGESNA